MSIADLSNILKIFSGSEPSPEERQLVFKETLLMTLARATDADSNVKPVEIESVQAILKRVTGDDISAADIRIAAGSEIYETAPLDKHLAKIRGTLSADDSATVVHCLAEVLKSDVQISSLETDFFDMVANALKVKPSRLAGLVPGE